MASPAIRVHGLGKQYRIGAATDKHRTFRESIVNGFTNPARTVRRAFSKLEEDDPDTVWALRDVSFDVQQGEVLGVIGPNGAGKSTLLKILARITEPSRGFAEVRGRVGSLLEVGTGFHQELTGRENVYLNGAILGMTRKEVERQFAAIVDFAEVHQFLDTPVKRYSSGMRLRLAFSVAAHLRPEILLVDEVLAVGDAVFQRKCIGKMSDVAEEGRTVIFVSHDLSVVTRLCDRGLVVSGGRLVFDGSEDAAVSHYTQDVLHRMGSKDFPPHVLHEDHQEPGDDFVISRIELLDRYGVPKNVLHTWDHVKIRVHFHAPRYIEKGAVELLVRTLQGALALRFSSSPDRGLPRPITEGANTWTCEIPKIPLAAGPHILGAGVAIPRSQWLYRADDLCRLDVLPADVFGTGMAPTTNRMIAVTAYDWASE